MNAVAFLVIASLLGVQMQKSQVPKTSSELEAATLDLVKAIERGDDEVSRRAIKGLIALGPYATAAVPALRRIVETEEKQWDAMRALGAIGPGAKSAVGCLVTLLGRHVESDLAKESLIKIGPCPAQVPRLVALLDDKDPSVRCNSAEVLGAYGEAATPAIPKLIELLKRNRREDQAFSQTVSQSAETALLRLGCHATPFLSNALADDRSKQQRWLIAYILGAEGQDERIAIPALKNALNDSQEKVQLVAAMVLRRLERRQVDADHSKSTLGEKPKSP